MQKSANTVKQACHLACFATIFFFIGMSSHLTSANAETFEIKDAQVRLDGPAEAGGHPGFEVSVDFDTSDGGLYSTTNDHTPKEVNFAFPVGMKINPGRALRDESCTPHELSINACPANSRLGSINIEGKTFWASPIPWPIWGWWSKSWNGNIYRVQKTAYAFDSREALIGYSIPDYGYSPPDETTFRIYSNSNHRTGLVLPFKRTNSVGKTITNRISLHFDGVQPSGTPTVTLPTRCNKTLDVSIRAYDYTDSLSPAQKLADSGISPTLCSKVKLKVDAYSNGNNKGSSGSRRSMHVNELQDQYYVRTDTSPEKDTSHSQAAVARQQIILPEGFRPGGVLWTAQRCSESDFGLVLQSLEATCSDASKIGSVSISSDIAGDLNDAYGNYNGSLFLGSLNAIKDDQTFSYRGKVFLQARSYDWNSEYSYFQYKTVGELLVRKSDGQISLTFGNRSDAQAMIPLAWNSMTISFNRMIVAPNACGSEQPGGKVTLSPWTASSTFAEAFDKPENFTPGSATKWDEDVDCPALRPFRINLRDAETENTKAGADTGKLSLSVEKANGRKDQDIKSLTVRFPFGMRLDLSSVAGCPGSGTCRLGSYPGLSWYGGGFSPDEKISSGYLEVTNVISPSRVEVEAVLGKPGDSGDYSIPGILETVPATERVELRLSDIPKDFDGIPFLLKRMDLSFAKGFLKNPDKCDATPFEVEATSHDGATSRDQIAWNATGCGP